MAGIIGGVRGGAIADENRGGLGLVAVMGVEYTEGGDTEGGGGAKSGPVVEVLEKLSGSGNDDVGVARWAWLLVEEIGEV